MLVVHGARGLLLAVGACEQRWRRDDDTCSFEEAIILVQRSGGVSRLVSALCGADRMGVEDELVVGDLAVAYRNNSIASNLPKRPGLHPIDGPTAERAGRARRSCAPCPADDWRFHERVDVHQDAANGEQRSGYVEVLKSPAAAPGP